MAQQKRNELRQLLLREGKVKEGTAPRTLSKEESQAAAIAARKADFKRKS